MWIEWVAGLVGEEWAGTASKRVHGGAAGFLKGPVNREGAAAPLPRYGAVPLTVAIPCPSDMLFNTLSLPACIEGSVGAFMHPEVHSHTTAAVQAVSLIQSCHSLSLYCRDAAFVLCKQHCLCLPAERVLSACPCIPSSTVTS